MYFEKLELRVQREEYNAPRTSKIDSDPRQSLGPPTTNSARWWDAHQSRVRSTYVHVTSCSGLGAPKRTTHTPVCQTSQNSHRWRTRFELSPASNQISTRVVGTVDTTYMCARENVTPVRPAWQAGQHQHQNRHYGVHRFSILVGPLH